VRVTTPKPRTRFAPGQSGNPAGKLKGTRHRVTLAVEALLEGEADKLTRKAVELALAGDTTALRLCLERIAPPRKDRAVAFALPDLAKTEDAVRAMAALVGAVAAGELTPSEASELGRLVEGFTRAVDTHELQQRLTRLEDRLVDQQSPRKW
jgi:Family of unknown function (DUF5681)